MSVVLFRRVVCCFAAMYRTTSHLNTCLDPQAHLTGETTPIPKSPLEEDGADVCLDPAGQHRPHILRSGSRLHECAGSGLHLYVLRTGAGTEQVGEMLTMPQTMGGDVDDALNHVDTTMLCICRASCGCARTSASCAEGWVTRRLKRPSYN